MTLDEYASKAIQLLKRNNLSISTVESCTGGMVSMALTGVDGASAVVLGGIVTYTNEMKQKLAYVPESTLNKFGAISSQTAVAMTRGGRHTTGSDVCISTTGNAGVIAVEGKPQGLIYIGVQIKDKVYVKELMITGGKAIAREKITIEVLKLLVDTLEGK